MKFPSRWLVPVTLALFAFQESYTPPQAAAENVAGAREPEIHLPLKENSVRFAIIGDNGNASPAQYQVADQMERFRQRVHFAFVLMLGDNLYGGKSAADYRKKFADPYKALLTAGVKFYASLGNHDDPNERFYSPFNMNGHRYYTFRRGDVTFFALDSTYMDAAQLAWLDQESGKADTPWKVCFFHHPLYSDARHGGDLDLRARLEPILLKNGINLVLSGHEHVYERLVPQKGIYYFVLGSSGQLRPHDLHKAAEMAKGFDTDRTFGLFEVSGKDLSFQIVSRIGDTVDSGGITLPEARYTGTGRLEGNATQRSQ